MREDNRVNVPLALSAIGMLYLTQGLPMGLAFMALPAILRSLGASTQDIGMIGIVILPWALKIFWAPFIDRFVNTNKGGRRYCIIIAQVITIILYGIFAITSTITASFLILFIILFLINLVSATQDVATDGWAIELLQGPNLAWANGLQISGFALGMLIGGSLPLFLFNYGGWIAIITLLVLITLLSIIPVFLMPRYDAPSFTLTKADKPSLKATLNRPGAFAMLSIAGLFYFSNSVAGTLIGPFLIDRGFSLNQIGHVTGIAASATIILGGAIGGWLTRCFNVKKVAIFSGAIAAMSLSLWGLLAQLPQLTITEVLLVSFFSGLASGISYVAFFTIFMQWASLKQAGTDFTAMQCMESWTNIGAAILAGQLAAYLGFNAVFIIASTLGIIFILWIAYALYKKIPDFKIGEK